MTPNPPAVRPPTPGSRVADVVVSVCLMVFGMLGFAGLAVIPLFMVAFSDSCSADRCDYDLMSAGALVGSIAPPVVFLAAIVWGLIRIGRRKTAWWSVVAGGVAAAVFSGIGIAMITAGVR